MPVAVVVLGLCPPRTVLDSGTNIYGLLSPDRIAVPLAGDTKEEVIDRLVDLLAAEVDDVEQVRRAILARERQMSTGVGSGVALPHAKTDSVRDTLVAFGVTEHPIEFGAIDDEPVRLVFLLVGPTAVASQHIRLLSRVSRMLNQRQIRERLVAAASVREVMMIFEEAEAALLVL